MLFPALCGRKSGSLEVSRDQSHFTFDDHSAEPVVLIHHRMQITLGGENSHSYFLQDPLSTEHIICVQNIEAIKFLAQNEVKAAVEALSQAKKKSLNRTVILGSFFSGTTALIFLLPLLFLFIPISWLNNLMTFEQEKKLGSWLLNMQVQKNQGSHLKAQATLHQLKDLLQKQTPELQKIPFEIYISNSSDVNAYALPGALIVFNKGLLNKAESVEEVIGVLAHEMAHVELRHNLKSLAGGLGTLSGFLILSIFIDPTAVAVLQNATSFASLKYSRDDEREADMRGLQYLHQAQISSSGMIGFFKKLQDSEPQILNSLAFLSTHPLSEERVQNLQQARNSLGPISTQKLGVKLEDLKISD